MQLSGGPYSYNRFDAFEGKLEEGSGASDPHKMKAKVDAAALKKGQESAALKKVDKKQEVKQEKETMDEGMMPLPKEKMERQSNKAYAKEVVAAKQGDGAGANKQMQRRIAMKDPVGRKNQLMNQKNEELNTEETGDTVMENNQRMAMYSRALGVMGAQYSGPGFGVSPLEEKKEDKEEDKKEKKGKKGSKPDYLDFDKDGDKEEDMKKALKDKDGHSSEEMDEEKSITKEMVVEYLVKEGYASNEVSAEILHTHISDSFLAQIEEKMITD